MHLNFIAETPSDGVVDRSFTIGEVPGVLWSPESAAPGAPTLTPIPGRARRFCAPRWVR